MADRGVALGAASATGFAGVHLDEGPSVFPDVYYLDRLAALGTIDTVPDNHGSLDDPLELDCSAAEQTVAAVAVEGIDVNALGESLQRQGTKAFPADWVTLQEVITVKAARFDAAV